MFRGPEPERSARDFLPPRVTLETLRDAASGCRGCDLYQSATQTVFGKGSEGAEIMFIGEQPGDKEDLTGEPFVGPAGKLLDSALREAGIERSLAYVTNVVKHFKWKPSRPPGKRRIHEKPNAVEVAACRPWLQAELEVVKPQIIVMLGSTAAQAIMGKDFRVTRDRGQFWVSDYGPLITATVHPSSILRSPDDTTRAEEMREFIRDLRSVGRSWRSFARLRRRLRKSPAHPLYFFAGQLPVDGLVAKLSWEHRVPSARELQPLSARRL